MEHFTIYANDNLDLIYTATKVCVRGQIMDDYEARVKTINNSIGRGHESVAEHSNIVMGLIVNKSEYTSDDFYNLLEVLTYLKFRMYPMGTDKKLLIIAGSVRGYKHIFRNIKNMYNPLLEAIKSELYMTTIKEYYNDFIKDNIMDANKFSTFIANRNTKNFRYENEEDFINQKLPAAGKIEVLNADNFAEMQQTILTATGIVVPLTDIFDFSTITIKFNHISRTASHQLVRHRNAISQESQRYVDYSAAQFINPIIETECTLENRMKEMSSEAHKAALQLDHIAEATISKYQDLIADGIRKEDARSILASNVETTLIMTFTFKNLIKAIELRTAKGAQAEIRNLFNGIKHLFTTQVLNFDNPDDIYDYICTCEKNNYYADIDENEIFKPEVISEVEEDLSEVTEELSPEDTSKLIKDLKEDYGDDFEKVYEDNAKAYDPEEDVMLSTTKKKEEDI